MARSTARLLSLSLLLLGSRLAHAMCYQEPDPQRPGKFLLCCPTGPDLRQSTCTPVPDPKPPLPPAPPPGPSFDEWNRARLGRWTVTVAVGAFGGGLRAASFGGDLSVRLHYRWDARFPAALWMFFIGNEVGLELRGGPLGTRSTDPKVLDHAWHAGGLGWLRLANQWSFGRWRFPAFPTAIWLLGVARVEGGPVRLQYGATFPVTCMLTRHLGLEADFQVLPELPMMGGGLRLVLEL
jgi:hypothetical protein